MKQDLMSIPIQYWRSNFSSLRGLIIALATYSAELFAFLSNVLYCLVRLFVCLPGMLTSPHVTRPNNVV